MSRQPPVKSAASNKEALASSDLIRRENTHVYNQKPVGNMGSVELTQPLLHAYTSIHVNCITLRIHNVNCIMFCTHTIYNQAGSNSSTLT
jgi:hypothetical protein